MNTTAFRRYTSLLIFICLSTWSTAVLAQQKIDGRILDANTGDPLIGANVEIAGTTIGTTTDYDGYFELTGEMTFPINLISTYLGYEETTTPLAAATADLVIKMSESSVTVDVIEVKAARVSDERKKSPLTVEALDALAIKETSSQDFYSGLGQLKGVDLTTASLGFTVINTRGFNSTSPVRSLQIIDGVDNQSPGLNFSLGNFLGASELDIQKAELIVGASSAFYGPNAFNGVLSMETKNPFFNKGLAGSIKIGERDLLNTAVRWADSWNNKDGNAWMAAKVNLFYLSAFDWVANNFDPISDSEGTPVFDPAVNPGRADAVNIYGDESSQTFSSLFDQNAGLNKFHRTGYEEIDLVDYNTENIKAGVAFHFRLQPSKDYDSPELIVASNYGNGTTVYQGDNRFSLRNINFWQNRIELRKKDKYFIRAYATNEDAGNSYDPYFTALRIQETAATDENWANAYRRWWTGGNLGNVFNRMKDLGYPADDVEGQILWQQQNADSLAVWHRQAAAFANSGEGQDIDGALPQPGTAIFDSLFNAFTSRKNNEAENGTMFSDRSALYHLHGEYTLDIDGLKDVRIGANGRLYRPNSEGTIFDDEFERISLFEYGIYAGASKDVSDFTFSAAIRMDKNQNFNHLFSPAASVVWNPNETNFFRLSFSSAIRNPTLSDQYLNLNVGPATLLGNLEGYENLVTFDSFEANASDPNVPFDFVDVNPVVPEKVQTLEIGYRTSIGNSLFLDASYYYNIYDDFLGFNILLDVPFDTVEIIGLPPFVSANLFEAEVFRISANSNEQVTTQGFALGANYYFANYYSLSGNYSWNRLNTAVEDNIVPAFNTPEHKFNVGLGGRNIPLGNSRDITYGWNINYKWIEGFIFEGSPQFTGFIPSYDMLDAQVNVAFSKINTTIKVGASNIMDNRQFQVYGGPRIGRMAYISATYDFKKKI
jgi:outer membrane receptor protein involved in Fe transport